MPNRVILRGDSYAIRRPLFVLALLDDMGQPFALNGCTVRTTHKPEIVPASADPTDASAPIKADITIDASGAVTASSGLVLATTPAAGVLHHRLTAIESAALPLGEPLVSDVELTDANGERFTWLFTDTLTAEDTVTLRGGA